MFPRRCLDVFVAKTLEGLLCHSSEQRALAVLVDLVQRFVEETGRRASMYRDLASRQTGALPDCLMALDDLGVSLESLLSQSIPKLSGTESKCVFFFFFFSFVFSYRIAKVPCFRCCRASSQSCL
jgi:hypothetical protein